MTAIRAMALALIVVGGVLIWNGNESRKTLRNVLSEAVLGETTRNVTILYVTGAGAIAIGVFGLLLGGKKR